MNPVRKKFSNGVKIAILGFGLEGKSALKFLKKKYQKADFEVRDIKMQGKNYLKGLENFDMIVRSPGIPYLRSEIQKAKKQGVKITSVTNLFFESASWRSRGKIIGITGTKGKGTIATLLYKILKAAEKNVCLAGNIGLPMLNILPKLKKNSITILELSSFQLQDMDKSPEIAIITDISPDHQDYHKSFKEYLDAKTNILRYQKSRDKVFYFADNKYAKLIAKKSRGEKIAVLPNPNLILKIPGFHNLKNVSMAAAAARELKVPERIIKRITKNFKGLPHRLEFVRIIDGVNYYNDSASTNPAATAAALAAFSEPKILIAGGAGKNLSYKPLAKAVKKSNMRAVILFGRDKYKIRQSINAKIPVNLVRNLKSAVISAYKSSLAGDIVLFSPGAASFDMFKNAKERGKYFTKLIKSL